MDRKPHPFDTYVQIDVMEFLCILLCAPYNLHTTYIYTLLNYNHVYLYMTANKSGME